MSLSIRETLSMDTTSLFERVEKILRTDYCDLRVRRCSGDGSYRYLYAAGQNPVCLVAHLDTVSPAHHENLEIVEERGVLRNRRPDILGADDRAGVYAVLRLIEICRDNGIFLPSVLFTNDEEAGCKGAREFVAENPSFDSKVNLFVEIDRKGADQYVHYNGGLPTQVAEYIESFGYVENRGTCSDVFHLSEKYGISSVNVSAGYYEEHTGREYLNLGELEKTIERLSSILASPIARRYPLPFWPEISRHQIYQNADARIQSLTL